MFTFELVALKSAPACEDAEIVLDAAANDQAAATPLVRRRPGYPGCRHFNENYIGSWLLDPALPTMSRRAGR